MSWQPFCLVVELRQGKLQQAAIALRDEAGEETVLHLYPKRSAHLEGVPFEGKPSLSLALQAAGYATGIALRLESPHPGGVRLMVDGREQKVIKRYGEVFRQVAALTDQYLESL